MFGFFQIPNKVQAICVYKLKIKLSNKILDIWIYKLKIINGPISIVNGLSV